MVALRPLIQPGNEAYVHHMVLYECHVSESKTWFEHHVGSSGAACYSPNMPPEWTFCLATNAWAWVSSRFQFQSELKYLENSVKYLFRKTEERRPQH